MQTTDCTKDVELVTMFLVPDMIRTLVRWTEADETITAQQIAEKLRGMLTTFASVWPPEYVRSVSSYHEWKRQQQISALQREQAISSAVNAEIARRQAERGEPWACWVDDAELEQIIAQVTDAIDAA